jgi:predicted aspartyl protease
MPGRAGAQRPICGARGQPMKHAMQSQRAGILQRAALLAMLVSPLFASAASPATSKCKLAVVVQIPINMRSLRPVIPATIDGHPSNMLIDTGSDVSVIFRSAAAAFGIHVVENGRKGYAAGGTEYAGTVAVRDLDLAGFVVHNLTLTAMGHGAPSDNEAGLLGEDFLSHWDEEFDPAAGVLRLMVPKDCSGDQVVYWAPQYSLVSLLPVRGHYLAANVQLNGHDVLAWFDTGASNTIVTTDVVQRPGLQPTIEVATGKQSHGLAPGGFAVDTAMFQSITIGQETIQNPKLVVADLFGRAKETHLGSLIPSKPQGVPEMLIGMDFLRAHRFYVARGQGKMYLTYIGGPVFLTSTQLAAHPQPAAPTPGATAGPGTAPPDPTQTPAPPPPAGTPDPAAPK